MNEKLYWIMLAGIFGPASQELKGLIKRYGTAAEIYRAVWDAKVPIKPSEQKQFSVWNKEKAEAVVKNCEENEIEIITFDDHRYPDRLKTIYDPPAVLYAYGDLSLLEAEMTIGVVGTRSPSQYAMDVAYRISGELEKVGFTIVSGFAAGIDSAAHRGALRAGGSTIAVLGCGVDVIYPKNNADIYEELYQKGLFLSEYPPGTPPLGKNFPPRNRIISGLSLGVFVAEAPLHSGALITADFAAEQGRDIFCLPAHDVFDRNCQGVISYLRDGAVPVFSHLDIIYEYCTNFSHKLSPVTPSGEYYTSRTESWIFSSEPKEKTDEGKKSVKKKKEEAGKTPDLSVLSAQQKTIVKLLLKHDHHADELCEKTGIDMAELLTELTEMEISGLVISKPGNIYGLKN